MKIVYLASPLGLSPEWKFYREKLERRLTELGCTILDPWEGPFHTAIGEASTIQGVAIAGPGVQGHRRAHRQGQRGDDQIL